MPWRSIKAGGHAAFSWRGGKRKRCDGAIKLPRNRSRSPVRVSEACPGGTGERPRTAVGGAAAPGSALVSSAGEGVPPSRTFGERCAGKGAPMWRTALCRSSFPRDSKTSTRDECAPESRSERQLARCSRRLADCIPCACASPGTRVAFLQTPRKGSLLERVPAGRPFHRLNSSAIEQRR